MYLIFPCTFTLQSQHPDTGSSRRGSCCHQEGKTAQRKKSSHTFLPWMGEVQLLSSLYMKTSSKRSHWKVNSPGHQLFCTCTHIQCNISHKRAGAIILCPGLILKQDGEFSKRENIYYKGKAIKNGN